MILRHQSGNAGPGSGDPAADQGKPGSAGNAGSQAPAGQDNAGGGGKSLEERFAALETEYNGLKGKHEILSKEVGKNADRAGKYDQLIKLMTTDKEKFITEFAEKAGVKIQVDAKSNLHGTLEDFQGEDGLKKLATAINQSAEQAADRRVSPLISKVLETHFAQQYPDWTDLSEDRTGIEAAVAAGQVTKTELMHFAVRGMKMPDALKEHGDKRFQEGFDAAVKEVKEYMADPGAAERAGGKKVDPKDYFKNVVLPKISQPARPQ